MTELGSLLALLALSVLSPLLAVRLRLPSAVVLIVAGIAAGPVGIGLVQPRPIVSFVSDFGFLVLMFVAGMEIDFAAIRAAGFRSLARPTLAVAGFFALAVGLGAWLGLSLVEVLVVSATSVGMPLAVLQEGRNVGTPLGRYVLLVGSIGEFVCIAVITVYELFGHYGTTPARMIQLAKVAALFVTFGAIIRWGRALVWWYPEPFRRLVQHQDVAELGVRVGLSLMLGFVVLANAFGVESILGAFLAGAMVGFVLHEKHALETKILALGHGLFIPVFFLVVGVRFDPGGLDAATVGRALLLVALAGAAKALPPLAFAPRELGLVERLAAGTLLAAPMTLVVAIGAIGQNLGHVNERQMSGLVLVAIAMSVVFPVAFRKLAATQRTADGAGATG